MKDIYYVNSAGKELDLLASPFQLQTGELFDYKWLYDNGFQKEVEERPLTLSITNYGRESYYAAIDRFFETVEYDVLHETPGRLYFGRDEFYLECYITMSSKTLWEYDAGFLDNEITLRIEKPFWIKEKTIQFMASEDQEEQEINTSVKTYPYKYSYEYEVKLLMRKVFNEHFTDADFELTIYGPASSPTIVIGGHAYQLNCNIQEGQYIKINSDKKTAYKVYEDGTTESVYDYRNRDCYIYEPIPSGMQTVSWDGSFGFDLKLIMKRSEPSWI